ncbi:unnamed protein product [marine sediment metagenome]|uniref:Uncharacterized protein n=1 Tax=marine sediment metagenome TaxID=412755 RepID=X0UJQ5_9ZZZZ
MPFQEIAAEYGALFELTCILNEGTITVTTTGRHKVAGTDLDPTFAFAAEISNGDYVSISVDASNTAALAGAGTPVVEGVVTNADAIIGRVINEPEWNNAPAATQNTWSVQMAKGYYRTANVEMMCVTGAHTALVLGAAGITNGCPVKWDLSANAYVDAGTAYTGAFCFHHWATVANGENLIGFGVFAGTTGNDDLAGCDVTA